MNPETGNISLRMDESFYFTNDSAELKKVAKDKLAKIIPVYADTLLSDPQIANRIDKIAITGYASPRYKGKPMDPLVYNEEAYNYNLLLSMDRARTITEYVFGNEIPSYRFKDKLRTLVNVSGQGYMNAVKLMRLQHVRLDLEASLVVVVNLTVLNQDVWKSNSFLKIKTALKGALRL